MHIYVINSSKTDPLVKVREVAGVNGVDVAVDNTGDPDIIALAYELTQSRGKTILVGVPKIGENVSIYSLPLHFGKVITGSHGGESNPAEDIPKYLRLYHAGRLDLNHMVTDIFTLDEINAAIEKMRRGKIAGRCLIKMKGDS